MLLILALFLQTWTDVLLNSTNPEVFQVLIT